jgi:hypothetical protein
MCNPQGNIMKTKLQHDDLMYGVLLAALISFAVATVLDEVPVDRFAAQQTKATQVATAQAATPVLAAKQASTVAR